MICFLIGSLGIIGLPPAGGALSKWYLMMGAAEADQIIFMFVWMTSSLLSAAYLLPIVYRAFFLAPTKGDDHSSGDATDDDEGIKEAPVFCLIGLGTAAVLTVVAFFMAEDLSKMLAPLAGKLG
jgi:multicomponent Na+:H+ antiporter subunit D